MNEPPALPASAAERSLRRAEWQPVVFAERLRRVELARLRPSDLEASGPLEALSIKVFRNHAFEYVASALGPFLAFAGFSPTVTLSDYDDALSDVTVGARVALVWLDFSRYAGRFERPEALAAWLASRVTAMRQGFDGPVLVADHAPLGGDGDAGLAGLNAALETALAGLAGVHLLPVSALAEALGPGAADPRSKALGSRWSDRLNLESARHLGLRWLPASVAPRLKALALDLDHTLYAGVLGEDGVQGVTLTEGHRQLQATLVALRARGLFLAVVSRNERADVDALFAARDDFALKAEHISAWGVSWGAKSEAIAAIAAQLRIGVDAVLFVDDNPGELAAVSAALPTVKTLHAAPEGALTARALGLAPGLFAWRVSREDQLRAADLAASEARRALETPELDRETYLASLGVKLTFAVPQGEALARVHELSNKTNQFNLGMARLSAAEVSHRAGSAEAGFVTVSLEDRLSDSGVIAVVGARREGETLVVDEVCISCRAMGRDLEDLIVGESVAHLATRLGAAGVRYRWRRGPRNGPALHWLARYEAVEALDGDDGGEVPSTPRRPRPMPVEIIWSM